MSLLIDHFGWLNNPVIHLDGSRLAAIALLAVALFLSIKVILQPKHKLKIKMYERKEILGFKISFLCGHKVIVRNLRVILGIVHKSLHLSMHNQFSGNKQILVVSKFSELVNSDFEGR